MLARWPSACCGIRVRTSQSKLPGNDPLMKATSASSASLMRDTTDRTRSMDSRAVATTSSRVGSECSSAIFALSAWVSSQLYRCGPLPLTASSMNDATRSNPRDVVGDQRDRPPFGPADPDPLRRVGLARGTFECLEPLFDRHHQVASALGHPRIVGRVGFGR